MELEKCYSTNDEDFCYYSIDKVLDELDGYGNLEVGATYYEADFRRMIGKDVVSIERLIEDMDERLYDECGECAEDGLDASKEAVTELEAFLVQWVDKHTNINRYYKIVGKSRPMQVTDADVAHSN